MADDFRNESDYSNPYAPPTWTAGPELPPKQSKWPTVIGIVAIVFACIGLLGGFCGLLSAAVMPAMLQHQPGGAPQIPQSWSLWMVVVSLIGFAFSVVLFICGIGLLKRRPWSPKLCTRWAAIYIIYSVISGIVNYSMQPQQLFPATQPGQPSPMPAAYNDVFTAIGFVIGIVWACALPVFLLIWFSRAKIKAEVAAWGVSENIYAPTPPMQS